MTIKKLSLLAAAGSFFLTGGAVLAGTPTYDKQPQVIQPQPELCGPWFSGITGGVWWVQDYAVSIPQVFAGDTQFEFETGFGINLTPIGYRFSDTFSLSLETGYHEADVDSATLFGGVVIPATGGQLRILPTLLNANLTIPVADRLSFYLSAGAGVAYRDLEAESSFVFPGATFSDSGWNAIAQAKAGVAFEVADCQFINVGYRYQHVFSTPEDIQAHSAEVGYTFTW